MRKYDRSIFCSINKMPEIILLLIPIILFACQATNTPHVDNALDSLIEAERNFSATSKAKGFHQAFVDNLADDGIVFAPGPVNGKKLHAEAPVSKALLTWYPVYAAISSSKDWGYTTGPYQFKLSAEADTIAGAGFYLSVWRKQPDGQWKVAIDMGNSFSPDLLKEEVYQPNKATANALAGIGTQEQLLASDILMVQPYYNETLIYRHDEYPYKYKDAIIEPASNIAYTTLGHELSPRADMAYTYGSYTQGKGSKVETGFYLKVWKVLEGQWKLVAHNLVPDKK